MDTNDKPTKDACVDVLKCGLRQMRYRLKKNYFDGVLANEVSTTSPIPYMDNVEWRNLVAKWSDPKNKVQTMKSHHFLQFISECVSKSCLLLGNL